MKRLNKIPAWWNTASLFWKMYALSLLLVAIVVLLGEGSGELEGVLSSFLTLPGTYDEREIVIWLITVILSALWGGFILSRITTKSLSRLRTAVDQLSQGDLEARISGDDLSRGDEIGELSRGFNYMADSLAAMINSERRLMRDMSHELRSPLTRLKIALELMANDLALSPPQPVDQYLGQLTSDVRRMDEMISQLLERARLDTIGPRQEALYPLTGRDIDRLVNDSVAELRLQATDKEIAVINEWPGQAVIWGEAGLLKRVIDNLLKNALNYAPAATPVTVRLRAEPEALILEVIDQGPGIEPEHLKNIFRPFYRASEARERESGGFGLGLAIVWQAVKIHRGRVAAENIPDEKGRGFKVTVTLPARSDAFEER